MKKKVIALACAAILLLIALPFTAVAETYAYVYTANLGSLNLREDTSVNSPIIGRIPYGKQVEVFDYFGNGIWASVQYNGKYGYVMTRYLVYSPPESPQPSPSDPELSGMFNGFQFTNYYVAVRPSSPGGFVHMRWAPSKQIGIMTDYYDNKQLEVLAQNNAWAQVRDPDTGRTGFMMRAFLREVGVGRSE